MKRVVMVTGAASGIGACVAETAAAAGYAVALVDRDQPLLLEVTCRLEALGHAVRAFHCDVSDEPSIRETVAAATRHFGQIDCLVNNAGSARDGHILDMSTLDWEDVVGTHLKGSFLLIREVGKGMAERGWGRIVNMSSISSLGAPNRANYVSAKAGMEGLTRAAAIDLAAVGITVNAVSPGFIETAMTEVSARRAGLTLEEHMERQRAGIPVGRIGQPADVARVVMFFLAEEADYITGQVIYVSGGPHH